ncbi:MAG: flagellar basal body P-ring formation protein FlgA [Planctomyces sp.]|nr:flagellar basal body P-ring formation protein FlgA [Planctomyces sp.]
MSKPLQTISALIAGLLMLCSTARGELRIRLRAESTVTSTSVRLGDIARVSGSNESEKEDAAKAVVGQLSDPDDTLELNAETIRVELALAGFDYEQIHVSGPEQVLVDYRAPLELTDADVESSAQAAVEAAFDASADDIRVRMASPLIGSLPGNIRKLDGLRAEVSPPARTSPGQMTLTVTFWQDRDMVASRMVRFDVQRRYQIAVARSALKRGHTIRQSDIQIERRFLDRDADQAELSAYVGMVLRQPVKAGEIMTTQMVDQPSSVNAPIAIKSRDRVRVIATRGKIKVTLNNAQALDSGRVGEVIRVVNNASKETLTGRVVRAGYVEAEF